MYGRGGGYSTGGILGFILIVWLQSCALPKRVDRWIRVAQNGTVKKITDDVFRTSGRQG
jgi:hypothetical protein